MKRADGCHDDGVDAGLARGKVIAIDGVAGAGKSTLASALARHLGLAHLDSGAMYRAVTLLGLRSGADLSDGAGLADLARRADLSISDKVLIDGRDVSAEIRSEAVDAAVSTVAAHPELRFHLVALQRKWIADHGGGVVEGRDIGTVVCPDADLKIFLVASEQERARRRAAQQSRSQSTEEKSLAHRDRLDQGRSASPLRPADDAKIIDTTDSGVDELVRRVSSWL